MVIPKVVFVDDEKLVHSTLRVKLQNEPDEIKKSVHYFTYLEEASDFLDKQRYSVFLIFLDHKFKYQNGEVKYSTEYIGDFKKKAPFSKLYMFSGETDKESLSTWLDKGVDKIIYKGSQDNLNIAAFIEFERNKYLELFRDHSSNTELPESISKLGLIGKSQELTSFCKEALVAAKTDLPVLIVAESGCGKEKIAHGIHGNSTRRFYPKVIIDCAKYISNPSLALNEIFGSVKGAFTDAGNLKGAIESAEKGTVIFDEVHHLTAECQAMLLRVLQEKRIKRLGDTKEKPVNVRFVFLAKPELFEKVKTGEFLPDLFYRIKRLDLTLSPIRDRIEDIEILIEHFKGEREKKFKRKLIFHKSAMELIKNYSWPNNVRDIENFLDRIFTFHLDPVVTANSIKKHGGLNLSKLDSEYSFSETLKTLEDEFTESQRSLILSVYRSTKYNLQKTSQKLGVARSTLSSKCEKLGISSFISKESKPFLKNKKSEIYQIMRKIISRKDKAI